MLAKCLGTADSDGYSRLLYYGYTLDVMSSVINRGGRWAHSSELTQLTRNFDLRFQMAGWPGSASISAWSGFWGFHYNYQRGSGDQYLNSEWQRSRWTRSRNAEYILMKRVSRFEAHLQSVRFGRKQMRRMHLLDTHGSVLSRTDGIPLVAHNTPEKEKL